jgi:hypothetical protein
MKKPVVPPISREITPEELPLSADWFRVPRAISYSGLPESTLYKILDDPKSGLISFTLKLRKGQNRGIRFILRQSIDAYLNRKAREAGLEQDQNGEWCA